MEPSSVCVNGEWELLLESVAAATHSVIDCLQESSHSRGSLQVAGSLQDRSSDTGTYFRLEIMSVSTSEFSCPKDQEAPQDFTRCLVKQEMKDT